ncbi:uncharacterized protein LACBIDRAFT_327684 [Laccaria bicolor S238N-H82]|uniref:Predicted protein n=1 Tax=Laccaria bicolor (strain S238N-H82 / ATCC MYA-4686) TaxID=486041 RepID=B0DCI4_LACBS|nr:uncharacterized protein LACBIDRAFT_327684 [Laccaria bicolor S238N-H82]EDR07903.1 predicted protein [Laccaria bicolor S238N-H82]|eukprot:XP_001881692.1 predicted protein [Laccaria bicolor S238N-H82]
MAFYTQHYLKNDLRKYELTDTEWQIAVELKDTLQILKDCTEYFSRGTLNLATVILAIDHINTTFTNAMKPDSNTHPAIRYGLCLAKKTLNKYYSLTDNAEVYCIAMVLHPKHKLKYFRQVGWTLDWINTAKALVPDEFERSYMNVHNSDCEDESKEEDNKSIMEPEKKSKNIFNNLPPSRSRLRPRCCSTNFGSILAPLLKPLLTCRFVGGMKIDEHFLDFIVWHSIICLYQSTRALLCLGSWSLAGLVKDSDVEAVTVLDEVQAKVELERLGDVLSKMHHGKIYTDPLTLLLRNTTNSFVHNVHFCMLTHEVWEYLPKRTAINVKVLHAKLSLDFVKIWLGQLYFQAQGVGEED